MHQWSAEELDADRLKIDRDVLLERSRRIEPLIFRDGQLYHFDYDREDIKFLTGIAYTWDPKNLVAVKDKTERDEDGCYIAEASEWYLEVARGSTHHSCGYHGLVKPTISEVLAQMPDNPRITAFYLDTSTARILYDGEGHIINVFWLTNISETIADKAARYARRHPDRPNIYE
jgi:hypothetical protein